MKMGSITITVNKQNQQRMSIFIPVWFPEKLGLELLIDLLESSQWKQLIG